MSDPEPEPEPDPDPEPRALNSNSILDSVKKVLGLDPEYVVFDLDIIMYINSAFSTLCDLGVGPAEGFVIEDYEAEWNDFLDDGSIQLSQAKTFVTMTTRLAFDPPTLQHLLAAMERQLEQLTFRLNVRRENVDWVNPDPPESLVVEEL